MAPLKAPLKLPCRQCCDNFELQQGFCAPLQQIVNNPCQTWRFLAQNAPNAHAGGAPANLNAYYEPTWGHAKMPLVGRALPRRSSAPRSNSAAENNMQSINTHLKILIAILVSLGIAITAYQIYVMEIPLTEDETDAIWSLDAKLEFEAAKGRLLTQRATLPCSKTLGPLHPGERPSSKGCEPSSGSTEQCAETGSSVKRFQARRRASACRVPT